MRNVREGVYLALHNPFSHCERLKETLSVRPTYLCVPQRVLLSKVLSSECMAKNIYTTPVQ